MVTINGDINSCDGKIKLVRVMMILVGLSHALYGDYVDKDFYK